MTMNDFPFQDNGPPPLCNTDDENSDEDEGTENSLSLQESKTTKKEEQMNCASLQEALAEKIYQLSAQKKNEKKQVERHKRISKRKMFLRH